MQFIGAAIAFACAAGCWQQTRKWPGRVEAAPPIWLESSGPTHFGEEPRHGRYILAIDQGTTSSRAIVFDGEQNIAGVGQKEFPQHFPKSGWVEHDLEDIWESVVETCRTAIERAGIAASDIAAIGITNQRETVAMWDRATGEPVHRAIVWQDRRTADFCDGLKAKGHEAAFTEKTGLLLDPYFSGTKIAWLLDNVEGLRARAEAGEIAFGTIDTFLIWRLTGGARHVTDATNASRTLIYNIAKQLLGRRSSEDAEHPVGDAAGGARLRRRFRYGKGRYPRRGNPGLRRCRRPAGGDHRPGLLRAGHVQVDLRHRLLRAAQYRRRHGRLEEPHAHDHRLPARRRDDLCAGRLDLHGRGLGAVAARRARHSRRRGAKRRDGRKGRSRNSRSIWCRPSSASARRTGTPMRAARCSA
jgi:hypothetical protein